MHELKKSVSQKLRMASRDYTRGGWYFVTLSADYHRHLFGEVVVGRTPAMACNELGRLVEQEWRKIPGYFTGVRLGAAQVMPNHFHGLLGLSGRQAAAHASKGASAAGRVVSLGGIINPFKGGVTRQWRRMAVSRLSENQRENHRKNHRADNTPPPCVWQPNYWDVICFDEEELAVREAYIRANPLRWALRQVPKGVIKKSRYVGNTALLRAASKRALRLSRKAPETETARQQTEALAGGAVVVSTFFSPGERAVLDRLLVSQEARLIWLVPMAMPKAVPAKWAEALVTGRALWLSAFPDEMTDASRDTCQLCNTWAERLERDPTP